VGPQLAENQMDVKVTADAVQADATA